MMKEVVSVVLGSFNRKAFLKLTIDSIRKELAKIDLESEIIVVDGGSTDGTLKWLVAQKDVISIIQHNGGSWKGKDIVKKPWGYFMNLAFKSAKGKYICMVSDDCLIIPGAIKNAITLIQNRIAANEKIGGAAFYWRDIPAPDNKYWVGTLFNSTYLINHGIFIKSALEEAGYIDEENYQFYYADSDLCLRMYEMGYKILVSENSFIEHYSHANYKQRKLNSMKAEKDKKAFDERWQGKEMPKFPGLEQFPVIAEFIDVHETSKQFSKVKLFDYHLYKNKLKTSIKQII